MAKDHWDNQAEYILSLLGYGIGVGTIWKFPYLVARNGGGSFLVPYFLFVLIGSLPLTYLEMFLGQYSQGNPVSAWEVCPAFKGLGAGAGMLSALFAIYYTTFFAWILYYLFYSFFPVLPWTQCGQSWNSPDCFLNTPPDNTSLSYNTTPLVSGIVGTAGNVSSALVNRSSGLGIPAAEDFFRNNLLEITGGLEEFGTLRWPLVLCLAITFFCVYICIIKGIRLAGKIVYVTVTCPYILVTVILIRACLLPGAKEGVLYYITPDFYKLADFRVWLEACSFALYIPGITYGILINMSSHNPVNNNCLKDAILFNIVCTLSQVYFGFSVFAVTGHLAHERNVTMDHYKTSGFKLGFITYPEATSYLPIPQLWSVLMFIMLFTLGIDSLIPSFEVVTNVIGHWFPRIAKRRWLLNALVMTPSFILALPYTAQGGVYLLTLVEWFAFFPSFLLFAMMECIAVAWIFGVRRVNKAMMYMWGRKLGSVPAVAWKYSCPLILLVIFGYSLYSYRPPQFEDYTFPPWANVIGWSISTFMALPLPVYFIWAVCRSKGSTLREKLSNACKPNKQYYIDDKDTNDIEFI